MLRMLWLVLGLVLADHALALTCGSNDGWRCLGSANQFAGGFSPGVGYGGFGGGSCTASKTPVVFIHGNGDRSISWDMPPTAVSGYIKPPRSVYDEFKANGYNDCELFGVTYLSDTEIENPGFNFHSSEKYAILNDFIAAVLAYTGAGEVDVVTHSMGSSMAIAALDHDGRWSDVRRFVNIAGGLRGLQSCIYYSAFPTCGSENVFDRYIFGFYPDSPPASNSWTSDASNSLRATPRRATGARFYTILAGLYDQIACTPTSTAACAQTSRFSDRSNVVAQVNVGFGASARDRDWDFDDGSLYATGGGDGSNGVGHFLAKTNTGILIYRMLATDCSSDREALGVFAATCRYGYAGLHGPALDVEVP